MRTSSRAPNFSFAHRQLTLSKELYRNIRKLPIVAPLDSLTSNLLLVLSISKEHAELLLNVDAPDDVVLNLAVRTEWLSTLLFVVLAKQEDLSAAAAEAQFLDAGVPRPSPTAAGDGTPAASGDDTAAELASFMLNDVAAHSHMQTLCAQMFPALDWLARPSSPQWRRVAEFAAAYYCTSSAASLPSPMSVRAALAAGDADEEPHAREARLHQLERFLFPLIFGICRDRTLRPAEDARFAAQCRQWAHAAQVHFMIRPALQSPSGWADAQARLAQLAYLVSPIDMLECVVAVAGAVFREAGELVREPLGGDDLLDVLCFVCLKASVPNLPSILAFMVLFIGEECSSEAQYYFTCVQLALAFVQDISALPVSKK